MPLFTKILLFLLALYAVYFLWIMVRYLRTWAAARKAKAPLGLAAIIRMRWRDGPLAPTPAAPPSASFPKMSPPPTEARAAWCRVLLRACACVRVCFVLAIHTI